MKIAHIAPPWIAIPPKNYGGTEIVLYNLIEEQVAQGHDVTLLAPGDARTSAKLISFFPHALGGRFNHVIIVDDADKAKRILEVFRLDIVWPFGETPGCNLLFRVASFICSIRSSIIPSLLATHIKASSPLLSPSRSGLTSTYSATRWRPGGRKPK